MDLYTILPNHIMCEGWTWSFSCFQEALVEPDRGRRNPVWDLVPSNFFRPTNPNAGDSQTTRHFVRNCIGLYLIHLFIRAVDCDHEPNFFLPQFHRPQTARLQAWHNTPIWSGELSGRRAEGQRCATGHENRAT